MADAFAEESDFSLRKIRIALTVMIGIGLGTTFLLVPAYPLMLPSITAEFHWTQVEYSFAFTLLLWFGATSSPILGWIVDRVGVRPMVIGGTSIVAALALGLSYVREIWQFYACYALLGVFGSTAIGYGKVVAALFTKHRGKAMAVLSMEGIAVGIVVPIYTRFLFEHYGWRGTYFWLGVTIFCVIPLQLFSLPEPGSPAPARGPAAATGAPPVLEGMTVTEALTMRTFWFLTAAHVFGGVALGVIGTFLAPMLMQHGYTLKDSFNFQSISAAAGLLGAIAAGFLMDRTRTAAICAPFCLVSAIAIALLARSGASASGALLWTVAILYGSSVFGRAAMAQYFQTRFFGLRAFAAVSGAGSSIMALIFGLASPAAGRIGQAAGSYDGVLMGLAVASTIGGLFYLMLGPYRYSTTAILAKDDKAAQTAAPA
jgi:MFS family permease